MRGECEARLRAPVHEGEDVLAVGTAHEFAAPEGDLGVQGRWRFVLVTKQRLLLADWSRPESPHEEIAFAGVTEWRDGTQHHRYVLWLRHAEIGGRVPASRRGFSLRRGPAARSSNETTLRFSHRDTAAATALRGAFGARSVPHGSLALAEEPRTTRTYGTRVHLTRANGPDGSSAREVSARHQPAAIVESARRAASHP
jgi:hypothetical protein